MNCRSVTATFDLNAWPEGSFGRLRYWLHMLHCRACRRYRQLSLALRQAVREYVRVSSSSENLDRLNMDLLNQFGSKIKE